MGAVFTDDACIVALIDRLAYDSEIKGYGKRALFKH